MLSLFTRRAPVRVLPTSFPDELPAFAKVQQRIASMLHFDTTTHELEILMDAQGWMVVGMRQRGQDGYLYARFEKRSDFGARWALDATGALVALSIVASKLVSAEELTS